MNVKLKKILSCFLIMLLLFNALFSYVVYADEHGGSSGDLDVTPSITIPPSPPDPAEFLIRMILPDGGEAIDYVSDWLEKRWKTDDDRQKDYSVSSDGSTVHFHKQFVDEFNDALQNELYALDGYFMIVPPQSKDSFDASAFLLNARNNVVSKGLTSESDAKRINADYNITKMNNYASKLSAFNAYIASDNSAVIFGYSFNSTDVLYLDGENVRTLYLYPNNVSTSTYNLSGGGCYIVGVKYVSSSDYPGTFKDNLGSSITKLSDLRNIKYGVPMRVFYTATDAKRYYEKLNNKKPGITFAPKLPSGGFNIPVKYINNSVSLPDINYNITYENKTEVQIQNEYDTILNNYITNLNDFTDGSEVTPTPKPTSTPTPKPTVTPTPVPGSSVTPLPSVSPTPDQEDLTSNDLLKKIYDQLVKLSNSVSQHFEKEETFEDKLSKYLESHDKKLDEIVNAIDKLSQGKEEGEEKGCKYDYTELSDFMTKLWNDSDQKFDQMVELLKENNEYQEKMLSTLNSIKNILLAQTVMDAFKNRSSETANKAKEKFPTSVPWDIALIVNSMDAEPKAPVFELPIKIERLNIDEKITVDISSGEWEKLAKACRYMLSLLFVLFMVNLTRKLFFSKGDD